MGSWKAGPEKPAYPFCWECGRRFHGRVHAVVIGEDMEEHYVHKTCIKDREVVRESTTVKP